MFHFCLSYVKFNPFLETNLFIIKVMSFEDIIK